MKLSSSIAFKISATSSAALAATVILLTVVGAMNVRSQAVDAFESSSRTRISQADESLDGTFDEIESNLNYLAGTAEVLNADPTLTDYLTRGTMTADGHGPVESAIFKLFKRFGKSHDSMRYLDMGTKWGGYVQWPIESFSGNHYDPRERPWYQLALATPDKVVRPAPYLNASGSGGAIISFSRVVKNPQGEVLGVLDGDISLEAFSKITSSIRFGKTGYLVVADNSCWRLCKSDTKRRRKVE